MITSHHVPNFVSHIAAVMVKPGWLEQVAHAQHAAPELLTFLEAARGQDPAFVLHGGVHFPHCTMYLLVTTSSFCLQLGDSASWCSQNCMIPGWVATSIPAARCWHCNSESGGLACVLTWQLTCPVAPCASV